MKSSPRKVLPSAQCRAFTLMELLVVIGVLLLLAALLMPALKKAHESAAASKCVSNLAQLGSALIRYAGDHELQMPNSMTHPVGTTEGQFNWCEALAIGGYLRGCQPGGRYGFAEGAWACPLADITNLRGNNNVDNHCGGLGIMRGFIVNDWDQNKFGGSGSVRIPNLPNPSRYWLVGEVSKNENPLGKSNETWPPAKNKGYAGSTSNQPAPRHGGKLNVCHFDGHVSAYTMKEVEDTTNGPIPFNN